MVPKLSLSHFQLESSEALTEINGGTLVKDLQNSQLSEAKDEQKDRTSPPSMMWVDDNRP